MVESFKQNQVPNEPTLKDLLDLHRKDIFLGLNCHHVGIIESFDATKQVAKVSIPYKKTFFVFTEKLGYQPQLVDYPVLVDAPVMFLGGGDTALTFPVAQGDECLVLFNDRNFDNWFQGNLGAAVPNPRLHSFADAIILVGLRSLPNVITSFNSTGAQLRTKDGTTSLTIDGDKAQLKKDDVTLNVETDKIVGTVDTTSITIDGNKAQLKKGNVTLNVESDKIVGNVGNTVTIEIDSSGKFKIENASGEYTAAILQLLTDIETATVATLMGPQLLNMPTFAADKLILESFEA